MGDRCDVHELSLIVVLIMGMVGFEMRICENGMVQAWYGVGGISDELAHY